MTPTVALITAPDGSRNQDQSEHIVEAAERRSESRKALNEPGANHRACGVSRREGYGTNKRNWAQEIDEESAGGDGGPYAIADKQQGCQCDSRRRPNRGHIPGRERDGETDLPRNEVGRKYNCQLEGYFHSEQWVAGGYVQELFVMQPLPRQHREEA